MTHTEVEMTAIGSKSEEVIPTSVLLSLKLTVFAVGKCPFLNDLDA
jgi:hypothetical protein